MRKWRKPFTQGVAWLCMFHRAWWSRCQQSTHSESVRWIHGLNTQAPWCLSLFCCCVFANQMITRSYRILNIYEYNIYNMYKYMYVIYIFWIHILYLDITDFDCILNYIVYVSLQPCAAAESREWTAILWVLGGVYDCIIWLKRL